MSDTDSDFTMDDSASSMVDIEPDSDLEEVSSQYDSCYSSGTDNTTTLFSEVTNYKFENGRRYHAYSEGSYWGPNDDKQNQQLEIFHHIFTLILDSKLYLAPIGEPKKVLDLGTGTGIWAIEMADKFPNTSILGNDLSPVQPTWSEKYPSIPANCTFEVDDFTRPWLYPPGSFDFIHSRGLYGCVEDWNQLLLEAYNALTPGGWFESVEVRASFNSESLPDGNLPESSCIQQWTNTAIKVSNTIGRSLDVAGRVGGWMEKCGFVNLQEKHFKIPHGPWPKDKKMKTIGKINYANVLEGSEGFTLALFTRHLGWTAEQTFALLDKVAAELRDHRHNLWMGMYVVYGQKPFSTDDPYITDGDSAYHSGHASIQPRSSISSVATGAHNNTL